MVGKWVHALRDAQVPAERGLGAVLGFVSRVKQNHGIEGRRRRLWENEFGELAGSCRAWWRRIVTVRDIFITCKLQYICKPLLTIDQHHHIPRLRHHTYIANREALPLPPGLEGGVVS